jgi:hypothetical protein
MAMRPTGNGGKAAAAFLWRTLWANECFDERRLA